MRELVTVKEELSEYDDITIPWHKLGNKIKMQITHRDS
jgi:hypothetical protein